MTELCPRCKTGRLMADTDRDFGKYKYCLACGHQVVTIVSDPIPERNHYQEEKKEMPIETNTPKVETKAPASDTTGPVMIPCHLCGLPVKDSNMSRGQHTRSCAGLTKNQVKKRAEKPATTPQPPQASNLSQTPESKPCDCSKCVRVAQWKAFCEGVYSNQGRTLPVDY